MATKIKKAFLCSVLGSSIFIGAMSVNTYAAETLIPSIEIINDAKVFAQFDDEIPAVINYFTDKSENDIVEFYNEKYGQPTSSIRNRGRLEKTYIRNSYTFKVIISPQNNKRQVDVLVTQ